MRFLVNHCIPYSCLTGNFNIDLHLVFNGFDYFNLSNIDDYIFYMQRVQHDLQNEFYNLDLYHSCCNE